MQAANSKKYYIVAWLICGLGALFYSYEYLLRITPSVMEAPLREHFGLSATGIGVLSAFYYYAYVPMQLPVGILLDRYGPKVLLTFACFICVLGTFAFAATHSLLVAVIARFCVGFGSAFAFVGVLKLATIWLPEDKLAMVSGLAAALGTIGAMFGDNLLSYMVTNVGWRETVNVTGIFGVVLMVVLWFGIRDKKGHQYLSGTIGSFRTSMLDLIIIMRNKQMWINGFYGCLVYLPTTVLAEFWGIPYLEHAHNMSQEAASFANSMLFLGFTIGAPLMGYISDHMRRRKPPMVVGALASALIMLIVLYMPGLGDTSITLLMFALGIFYSAQCIVFAVGRELSPNEAAGTAMAMTNMVVMFGAMLLQPLVGRLLDLSISSHSSTVPASVSDAGNMLQLYSAQDYQFALAIIPVGIIVAACLTYFLKETHADAPN